MIRKLIQTGALCLFISVCRSSAQELFVYTEPASNMPAGSWGLRLSNNLMEDRHTSKTRYLLVPELMWGVNKNLMLHAEGFLSDRSGKFKGEGAGVYAKYRFFTTDKVYRHFRMAAFGRLSTTNIPVHYEEVETNGFNSGYELGLIATQLLHKQAIAASVSFEQAGDNSNNNEFPRSFASKAINYTLSTGRLILPASYKSYKQTNLNIMVELLGQSLPENGKAFLDIAPSIQLIVNSQTRIDIGYRHQIYGNMERMAEQSFLLRVEHLLFRLL